MNRSKKTIYYNSAVWLLCFFMAFMSSFSNTLYFWADETDSAEPNVVRSANELKQAILNASPGDVILVDSFKFENSIGFNDMDIDVTLKSYNENTATLTLAPTISPYYIQFLRGNITLTFDNVVLDGAGGAASMSFNLTDPSRRADLLTVNDGVFLNFGGRNNGGVLHSEAGCITLNNCTFIDNHTADNKFGGALYLANGNVIINNSRFDNNGSGMSGGAAYVNGDIAVTGSSFDNNACGQTSYGGAISAGGTAEVTDSTFSNNKAGYGGGALELSGEYVIIQNSIFDNNNISPTESNQEALSEIYSVYGINNHRLGGGAINFTVYEWNSDFSKASLGLNNMSVKNSRFVNNTGLNGGGILNQSAGSFAVENCRFDSNEAFIDGGGIFTASLGELTVDSQTVFQNNTASRSAIWTVDTDNDKLPYSAMHEANIFTSNYSDDFTNAYNNFDINMTGSEAPTINPVKVNDNTVTGKGKPGSMIIVWFPDGSTSTTVVDAEGDWIADVPSDTTLTGDDTVYASQAEVGSAESVKTNTVAVDDQTSSGIDDQTASPSPDDVDTGNKEPTVITNPSIRPPKPPTTSNNNITQDTATDVPDTTVIENNNTVAQTPTPQIKNHDTNVTSVNEDTAYYTEFSDELVPLGFTKVQTEDEENNTYWMIIPNDNPPFGNANIKTNPATGDSYAFLAGIISILLMAAFLTLITKIFVVVLRSKR